MLQKKYDGWMPGLKGPNLLLYINFWMWWKNYHRCLKLKVFGPMLIFPFNVMRITWAWIRLYLGDVMSESCLQNLWETMGWGTIIPWIQRSQVLEEFPIDYSWLLFSVIDVDYILMTCIKRGSSHGITFIILVAISFLSWEITSEL